MGTREAAFLLGICCQRVRVLLAQGRIKGAYKHKGFWRIPLYNRMPVVIPGKRGPQGVWCKGLRQAPTRIHVNQRKIKANSKRINNDPLMSPEQLAPVITMKQNNPLSCGARLWIETYSPVQFVDTKFNPSTARRPYRHT
ncbi:MAG: helix-turn-helix domain-containing protein [Okeania sp. SIO2C2]|nr:helix-turn-helix domain-containing protein [Okeania sp. SIO2C2]